MSSQLTGPKRVLNDSVVTLINLYNDYNSEYGRASNLLYSAYHESKDIDYNAVNSVIDKMTGILEAAEACGHSLRSLGELHPSPNPVYHNWSYGAFGRAAYLLYKEMSMSFSRFCTAIKRLEFSSITRDEYEAIVAAIGEQECDFPVMYHLPMKLKYESNLLDPSSESPKKGSATKRQSINK